MKLFTVRCSFIIVNYVLSLTSMVWSKNCRNSIKQTDFKGMCIPHSPSFLLGDVQYYISHVHFNRSPSFVIIFSITILYIYIELERLRVSTFHSIVIKFFFPSSFEYIYHHLYYNFFLVIFYNINL